MLETMYVRCTHCGYDNSPEYRFCGMCGGSLAHPVAEARPPVREVAPLPTPTASTPVSPSQQYRAEPARPIPGDDEKVHGPSFLGLSEGPKVEFNYLYEDEPTRSHAGLIVFLLLLLGGGGFLGWQWRHHAYQFNQTNASSATAAPAPVSPDTSQNQAAQPNKPADKSAGGGDVEPTAPEQ